VNRRGLLTLSVGLIVGEPARRAYSFLNGSGLDTTSFTCRWKDSVELRLSDCIVQFEVELLTARRVASRFLYNLDLYLDARRR
jgi:hypothetical protein